MHRLSLIPCMPIANGGLGSPKPSYSFYLIVQFLITVVNIYIIFLRKLFQHCSFYFPKSSLKLGLLIINGLASSLTSAYASQIRVLKRLKISDFAPIGAKKPINITKKLIVIISFAC